MNTNNKTKVHQTIQPRNLILLGAIMLVGAVVIYLLSSLPPQQQTNTTRDSSAKTYITTGKVTEKQESCGGEKLLPDGTVKHFGGLCDSGNWLTVNNMRISTGGGALKAGSSERIDDINNVHPGDQVEIRYTKDENNILTTNCDSCYVKLK